MAIPWSDRGHYFEGWPKDMDGTYFAAPIELPSADRGAACIIQVHRLFAPAIRRDVVRTALVTFDVERIELAYLVAEGDGAIAGHHNHPSTSNARSICAVAASMSSSSLVTAAFSSSSAAKSQCGRAWRQGFIRPTKRGASS